MIVTMKIMQGLTVLYTAELKVVKEDANHTLIVNSLFEIERAINADTHFRCHMDMKEKK